MNGQNAHYARMTCARMTLAPIRAYRLHFNCRSHREDEMKRLSVRAVINAAFAIAATLPCLALAKGPAVYEKTDSFSGKTLYYTAPENPKLEGGSFFSERYVLIKFEALSPIDQSQGAYTINIDASLQNWIFISSGKSLDLKLDGQIMSLSGPGSIGNRDVSTDGVEEVADYSFSGDVLKKIAAANSIQFRLYGDKGVLTGTFTPKMMDELRLFAAQVPSLIGDRGASAAPTVEVAKPAQPNAPVPQSTTQPLSDMRPASTTPLRFGASFTTLHGFTARIFKVPTGAGAYVVSVESGSPAEKAGLSKGDVIVTFDGKSVAGNADLQQDVKSHVAGQPAKVGIYRDGNSMQLTAQM